MSAERANGDRRFYASLVLFAVFSVAALAAIAAAHEPGQSNKTITLEEIFAGLNVAIAACAFVGLIVTIRQQHKEIEQTQAELRGQKEQLEKQANVLDLQQFEGTFFNLIRLHHQIVEGMSDGDDSSSRKVHGRAVLVKAESQTIKAVRPRRSTRIVVMFRAVTSAELTEAYRLTYEDKGSHLGHYFRNFYHVVKFVDTSRLSESEKRRYVSFARAQLSHPETILMFFNGLSPLGTKMKPYIEQYALLEDMPYRSVLRDNLYLYARCAYGTNEELLKLLDATGGLSPDHTHSDSPPA